MNLIVVNWRRKKNEEENTCFLSLHFPYLFFFSNNGNEGIARESRALREYYKKLIAQKEIETGELQKELKIIKNELFIDINKINEKKGTIRYNLIIIKSRGPFLSLVFFPFFSFLFSPYLLQPTWAARKKKEQERKKKG
eukprot:TRINITY_DN4570_c1_g1_i1.p1 TRINITY_DN4570_c1_g1~~TRINITY_DN4570_c1_g1_i1.p1  ORF type:complete len:139 (-),score=4.17 TRINITY_DN4570_c1_g1_i1:607-1023(-)